MPCSTCPQSCNVDHIQGFAPLCSALQDKDNINYLVLVFNLSSKSILVNCQTLGFSKVYQFPVTCQGSYICPKLYFCVGYKLVTLHLTPLRPLKVNLGWFESYYDFLLSLMTERKKHFQNSHFHHLNGCQAVILTPLDPVSGKIAVQQEK